MLACLFWLEIKCNLYHTNKKICF